MPSTFLSVFLAGLLAFVPAARAGFNPDAEDNISVYWGQNSFNKVGSQQGLAFYCKNNPSINIYQMAFLTSIAKPSLNLANIGDNCTTFDGTGLLRCPEVEADIKACQSRGKTIMLSIGGATYSEGGFSSTSAAVAAAKNIWAMFGPVQSGSNVPRPFGTAVVDGFDFDFESPVQNMAPFVSQLRTLSDTAKGKNYYLSAAPQCPYPDLADQSFINGQVAMDFLQVQFYNNFCGVGQYPQNWNFGTWDNWAKTVSANPKAKVLIGIPGNVGGAGAGSYASGPKLAQAIANGKSYSSFGGVMVWDMSQLENNPGFLDEIVSDLGGSGSNPPASTARPKPTATPKRTATPTPTKPPATTLATITRSARPTPAGGSGTVPRWGQCGGAGYTGPTRCVAPFKCVSSGAWWSQCQ